MAEELSLELKKELKKYNTADLYSSEYGGVYPFSGFKKNIVAYEDIFEDFEENIVAYEDIFEDFEEDIVAYEDIFENALEVESDPDEKINHILALELAGASQVSKSGNYGLRLPNAEKIAWKSWRGYT